MARLKQKLLVTRTDRLGDVLLSLPVFQYLRHYLPECEIHFLCREDYAELVSPYLSSLYVKAIRTEFSGVWALQEALRTEHYSAGLYLYGDLRLATASVAARIPRRVGPFSKPWSYLLYNKGLRQQRSTCERHEAEYNLELAQHLVGKLIGEEPEFQNALDPITLPVNVAAKAKADATLSRLGLTEKGFFVLHPGMGGSARNLSAQGYIEWLPALTALLGVPAVLSVGPASADKSFASALLAAVPSLPVIQDLRLTELMEVFRQAKQVIAPSTGPLHLAHYAGTDTLGIYPPDGTERQERWRPWGGSGHSRILVGKPGMSTPNGPLQEGYLGLDAWQNQVITV